MVYNIGSQQNHLEIFKIHRTWTHTLDCLNQCLWRENFSRLPLGHHPNFLNTLHCFTLHSKLLYLGLFFFLQKSSSSCQPPRKSQDFCFCCTFCLSVPPFLTAASVPPSGVFSSLVGLINLVTVSAAAAAAAESLQSCLTLCNPIDDSPPDFPAPGILQARTLDWVAIFFSNTWKWKVKVKSLSHVWLFATPWTVAYQAPLSLGFSRQEYWSGVHCLLQPQSLSFSNFCAITLLYFFAALSMSLSIETKRR